MKSGRVAWIHVAPVKGLALQARDDVLLEKHGVRDNRRFYVADSEGRMLNGKRLGRLGPVHAAYDEAGNTLELRFPDGRVAAGEIALGEPLTADFYGRPVGGHVVAGPWAEALSAWAGRPLRLVRPDNPALGLDRGPIGAVSLVSTAALDALARAAGVDGSVDGRRFRMLFGVEGIDAHAEDEWIDRSVRIGEALVAFRSNVGRCAVTTQDPDTGQPNLDTLRALKEYRGEVPTGEPLPFGIWGRVVDPGRVRLGDDVVPG